MSRETHHEKSLYPPITPRQKPLISYEKQEVRAAPYPLVVPMPKEWEGTEYEEKLRLYLRGMNEYLQVEALHPATLLSFLASHNNDEFTRVRHLIYVSLAYEQNVSIPFTEPDILAEHFLIPAIFVSFVSAEVVTEDKRLKADLMACQLMLATPPHDQEQPEINDYHMVAQRRTKIRRGGELITDPSLPPDIYNRPEDKIHIHGNPVKLLGAGLAGVEEHMQQLNRADTYLRLLNKNPAYYLPEPVRQWYYGFILN